MTRLPMARLLGKLNGSRVFLFRVLIRQSNCRTEKSQVVDVIAKSSTDAVNLVRDEVIKVVEHPTEIECAGPQGGRVHRFIGWETMIGEQVFRSRNQQLNLL